MDFTCEKEYDILVAGGGVAGVAAAVEAARSGKRVVLIEKSTQLGGLATIGLVNFFVPMCNGRGVQIVKGMAEEFLQLSKKYGYDTIPSDWQNGEPGYNKTTQRYVCKYSAPIFSLVLCELLDSLNVDIMFDSIITDVNITDGTVDGAVVFNKSGYSYYRAKMFVDGTGDADLLHYAGVPTVKGKNYHTYYGFGVSIDSCKRAIKSEDVSKLPLYIHGGDANLYGENHPKDMKFWDGTNGEDVTEYLRVNQLEMLENIKNDNRKSRDITILPIMPQFRTTRHIDGEYTLKESDAYKHFDDSVCAICDFDRRDFLYEVSFGTMIKKGFNNIIAVGRCAAAEGYAWDILRVIPPAILTGQAAGAAVSQAIDEDGSICTINIKKFQERLESENVIIHFDDSLIPKETKIEKVDIGHF